MFKPHNSGNADINALIESVCKALGRAVGTVNRPTVIAKAEVVNGGRILEFSVNHGTPLQVYGQIECSTVVTTEPQAEYDEQIDHVLIYAGTQGEPLYSSSVDHEIAAVYAEEDLAAVRGVTTVLNSIELSPAEMGKTHVAPTDVLLQATTELLTRLAAVATELDNKADLTAGNPMIPVLLGRIDLSPTVEPIRIWIIDQLIARYAVEVTLRDRRLLAVFTVSDGRADSFAVSLINVRPQPFITRMLDGTTTYQISDHEIQPVKIFLMAVSTAIEHGKVEMSPDLKLRK